MISQIQAIALGVVQGLTEFLPVSSSGHLVLGQHLLGLNKPELLFDVVAHVGTLLAVAVYFRRDLLMMLRGLWAADSEGRQGRQLIKLVILGSIPAGLAGFLFKDNFEALFGSLLAVGCALCLTGCILLLTRLSDRLNDRPVRNGPVRAFLIGVAQAIAICPGISRSGSTIACGLLLGLERSDAARFSFVLSIPAILGALLLQLIHLDSLRSQPSWPLILGGASAAISGYLALSLLVRIVNQGRLHIFAPYCFLAGAAAVAWSILA